MQIINQLNFSQQNNILHLFALSYAIVIKYADIIFNKKNCHLA